VVDQSVRLRSALYRLRRQGMLELEAWLQPLARAMLEHVEIQSDVEALLALEVPELEYMMHHRAAIPVSLRVFLDCEH